MLRRSLISLMIVTMEFTGTRTLSGTISHSVSGMSSLNVKISLLKTGDTTGATV